MAKIPLGDFGNNILRPGPQVQIVPGAFDNGGAALADLGNAGLNVASAMAAENRQEAERLAREKKQEQDALARARAANAVLERQDQMGVLRDDITQRLETGQIRYDDAIKAFDEASSKLNTPDVGTLDPATQANLENGYKRIGMTTRAAVVRASDKAMTGEFRSRADSALDLLGKQASLPGVDMGELARQADTIDEIGIRAYGAAWGKKKQEWMDGNWNAHLNQKAMSVRDNLAGIKQLQQEIAGGQYADKLDSDRRNTIAMRLDGYRNSLLQRQEMAAQRAERERERHMRQAEAEFNTFQALADKGTIIAPEYVDRVVQMTAGTPYQAGVKAIAEQARETGGIAAQPLAVQQATLDAIDRQIAQQGRTPELDRRREQVSKVMAASKSDLKTDGLRAGLERGVLTDLAPIDVSTPASFEATIATRVQQAETVSAWSGRPVSPLDANEAEQLRTMLDALPAKEKSQAIATIAESIGPRAAGALSQQLDDKDKALSLAFASSGSKTTAGRYTSELILKGATAIKDGVVMKDDKKVTGWRATIAQQVDGAFPDERAANAAKEAAYLIAAGIAQENGGSIGGKDLERAVRLAIGGDIIEHNGKKIPIPAELDDFEDSLKSIPVSDIQKQAPDGRVIAGGVEVSVEDFAKSIPGQELVYAGPGRYAVIVRGRPVTNSEGRRVYIRVGK